ncbi:DUF6783 domain-containing protein [Ruminococcus sp. 2227st1_E6_2227SCRN_220401]|uniref:DUF6783 domain-containing protein n=1 Tax=unclassified Ruminococcus TaxID=2608920 RepID=UPI00319DB92D
MKNHSRNLHAPLCGRFHPNSVAVARYGALIRAKSPTNCDAHLAESLFQTRSKTKFTKIRLHFIIYAIIQLKFSFATTKEESCHVITSYHPPGSPRGCRGAPFHLCTLCKAHCNYLRI